MWSKDADEHAAEHLAPFERDPTRAKSREGFVGKGSDANTTPPGSLDGRSGEPHLHRAKRARVENIISSPGWETKRDPVRRPEVGQKRHLSETLTERRPPTWNCSPRTTPRANVSLEPDKVVAEVLKYELSRAVSQSVDSVFKSMSLIRTAESFLNAPKLSGRKEARVLDVQTEALALVVQRPHVDEFDRIRSNAYRRSHDSKLRQDRESDKAPNSDRRDTQERRSESESRLARPDAAWNAGKVRSRVRSGSPRSPSTGVTAVDPMLSDGLCFRRVEIESSGLLKNHLYVPNEGLTTNHLKKAKLMFFYTRYPSSPVLKMCFRDVQFTRCIASQLIKWFSNFREFYYIQIEKFARHAVAAHPGALSVGRESQLFRALNVHYNKSGDFQVPNRFLEVAEITLREFYTAISTGMDGDPSWKKAIYKVICKLDADVPAQFKTYG
ncbi:prospero homeobox protein 1-like isoform X1 [Phyllopteryx taeniolatus]|uniref:prospero homeobox protein 1-like isoform X1 n=1 Tax=Phyllopteryx taeniolatus TaxID=161469 RepID=UPI002AD46D2A|nr:prospero homeobox protein 1-like isoform X1 [Phyllopteryx taeniolatus]